MEDRSFEDIINAMLEDETWEVPEEERLQYLEGLAWTLNTI